jgi:para-nitrobenzyl esterase
MKAAALVAAILLTAAPAAVLAQGAPPPGPAAAALANAPARNGAKLTVTSPAFKEGGDIPFENTAYRDNRFPGLSWTGAAPGAQSYAVVLQDTDVNMGGLPALHWTVFNLPANTTSLAAGLTAALPGASFGPSFRGKAQPYFGPRPPPGPKHHYHFQVFALDSRLTIDPATAAYDDLLGAMKGHVVASGELIGLAEADPNAPPRPGQGGGAAQPAR